MRIIREPTVKLLGFSDGLETTIAAAGKSCYSSDTALSIGLSLTKDEVRDFIRRLKSMGHLGALEHGSITFELSGVSRTLTHQLVRHRVASYNQQSQRYVKFDPQDIPFVVPERIATSPQALSTVMEAVKGSAVAYGKLLELGMSPDEARCIIPNGVATNIVVTMNPRELLHFFGLRCCNRASDEINVVAWKMLGFCKMIAPTIFEDAGPGCVRGKCPEGKMSCGKPYPKFE